MLARRIALRSVGVLSFPSVSVYGSIVSVSKELSSCPTHSFVPTQGFQYFSLECPGPWPPEGKQVTGAVFRSTKRRTTSEGLYCYFRNNIQRGNSNCMAPLRACSPSVQMRSMTVRATLWEGVCQTGLVGQFPRKKPRIVIVCSAHPLMEIKTLSLLRSTMNDP